MLNYSMLSHNPTVIFRKTVPEGVLPVAGEHIVYDNTRTIDVGNARLDGGFLTQTIAVTCVAQIVCLPTTC